MVKRSELNNKENHMKSSSNTIKKTIFLLPLLAVSLISSSCSTHYSDYDHKDVVAKLLLEKSFQVTAGGKLGVEVVAADVEVTTWSQNEVSVKIYGDEDALDKVDIAVEQSGNTVSVSIEKKSFLKSLSNLDLRVEVKTPASYSAEVKTSGGFIKLKDMNGSLALKTSGGNIGVANSSGSLDARTSGGDVKLGKFKGSAKLHTSGGNVQVKDVEGSVEAGTSGGDVEIDSQSGSIVAKTSGGSIRLKYTGENQGIECSTSGGDIDVYVPESFKADVMLKTSGGSVSCELPASNVKTGNSSFTGSVNGGGVPLICKTSGGSISLNKLK